MRLQRYLNEKFFDGFGDDYYVEIFKNPTKKDLRDVEDDNGYRIFIDMKNKNVYVASSEVWHMQMIDNSDKLHRELGMDWGKYWSGQDKTNSYIIMGDANPFMRHFNSDSLTDLSMYGDLHALAQMRKLLRWDYKWLSKYGFDPKEVYRTVERAYETLAEKRGAA